MLNQAPSKIFVQNIAPLCKDEFPIFQNKELVYLDNAATAHKPRCVIDRMSNFLAHENATVRRGVYKLSEKATQTYEGARKKIAKFLNASSPEEIIFTKGATEALNLVAYCFGAISLREGDEVLITAMEHHANIVPWQVICQIRRAKLKVVPLTETGELDLDALEKLITDKTKILALTHISNVLGTVNPLKEIIALAHNHNVPVVVDGSQATPHTKIDLQDLKADFYVFSGHKAYGPTGIGVLYGRKELLVQMPPYQTGGDMIETVSFERTTFALPPYRFEAGTPPIAQAIGLGAALDFIDRVGLEQIATHEDALLHYATEKLSEIPGLKIYGTAKDKASLISFTMDCAHPHDIGTVLDDDFGVAVRAGHHCAQPLMKLLGVPATTRASFALYNGSADVDKLVEALWRVREIFA